MNKTNTTLAMTLGAVVFLFISFLVVMWQMGLFDLTSASGSSDVVVASLTLVGGLATAFVAIIVAILQHSASLRAEERQYIEGLRLAASQRETEGRLKLEAGVQALQLFTTDSGDAAPAIQRDGALFVLSSLKQFALIVPLIDALLTESSIRPATAVALLDSVLRNGAPEEKRRAVSVFDYHAQRLATSEGADIPSLLLNWDGETEPYVREWGVSGICRLLRVKPVTEWRSNFRGQANSIVAALAIVYEDEPADSPLRLTFAMYLSEVLVLAVDCGSLAHPLRPIDVAGLRNRLPAEIGSIEPFNEEMIELRAWARQAAVVDMAARREAGAPGAQTSGS